LEVAFGPCGGNRTDRRNRRDDGLEMRSRRALVWCGVVPENITRRPHASTRDRRPPPKQRKATTKRRRSARGAAGSAKGEEVAKRAVVAVLQAFASGGGSGGGSDLGWQYTETGSS
jgi:hypothetical protein